MITLKPFEEREQLFLASYAMHSCDSAGRVYPEQPHQYRAPYARDRDRVLHSSAFRRLAGKMQVFTGEMGVYHRTRLTHSFEVASVARTMARALRLNEDLTEALALMHDIGHPPFGHCGEDALHDCMSEVGGFSHNGFALVIVQELEQRYTNFAGLNLTAETLGGQDVRAHKAEASEGRSPLLEVQLVDIADSIAYDAHDVDDALQMGLISIEELSELALVQRSLDRIGDRHGRLPKQETRQALVHEIIDIQVTDALDAAIRRLQSVEGYSCDQACNAGVRLEHSPELNAERAELESFLFRTVYRHPRLLPMREAAAERIQQLFEILVSDVGRLPLRFRQRAERRDIRQVAGEYIAGMTDKFCDDQHRFALQTSLGPLADW